MVLVTITFLKTIKIPLIIKTVHNFPQYQNVIYLQFKTVKMHKVTFYRYKILSYLDTSSIQNQ